MFDFDNNDLIQQVDKILMSKKLQTRRLMKNIRYIRTARVSNNLHFHKLLTERSSWAPVLLGLKAAQGRNSTLSVTLNTAFPTFTCEELHLVSSPKTTTHAEFSLSHPQSLLLALSTPQRERLHPICE